MAQISIEVNGEARAVAEGTSVSELIEQLGYGTKPVAVERNRQVVPRAKHAETTLTSGDRVELVSFVGGG